jgi:hypothetical protein
MPKTAKSVQVRPELGCKFTGQTDAFGKEAHNCMQIRKHEGFAKQTAQVPSSSVKPDQTLRQ